MRLLIAGDGAEKVRLHALALALGIKDWVTFLGEVGADRIRTLLSGCEFLVLSSWIEGVPTVLLEAMASGKAVVATDVGGVSEVVKDGHNGLWCLPARFGCSRRRWPPCWKTGISAPLWESAGGK